MRRQYTMKIAMALALVATAACANTLRGVKQDAEGYTIANQLTVVPK